MHLNSCHDVSDLTQKEFLKPGETELALISKSMVFKFSFFLFFLPLAGVGTWEQDRINYRPFSSCISVCLCLLHTDFIR